MHLFNKRRCSSPDSLFSDQSLICLLIYIYSAQLSHCYSIKNNESVHQGSSWLRILHHQCGPEEKSSVISNVQLQRFSGSFLIFDVSEQGRSNPCCSWEFVYLENPELYEQRNIQGKIIILYDEDERIASQAATTMCERGFENLFMLSGGESPRHVHTSRLALEIDPISSWCWRLEGDSTEVSRRNDHRLFSRRLPPVSGRILGSEARHAPSDATASRKQMEVRPRRPQQDPDLPGGGAHTQRDQQWVIGVWEKNPEPFAY